MQKNPSAQNQTSLAKTTQNSSTDLNSVEGYRLPDNVTLQYAAKLSVIKDKPIMFDYWTCSLDKTSLIGVKDGGSEKLLVKSEDEYTSPIVKIYKVSNEYIIETENSIYLVDLNIPTKRISN
jgi:hypothetical protein